MRALQLSFKYYIIKISDSSHPPEGGFPLKAVLVSALLKDILLDIVFIMGLGGRTRAQGPATARRLSTADTKCIINVVSMPI